MTFCIVFSAFRSNKVLIDNRNSVLWLQWTRKRGRMETIRRRNWKTLASRTTWCSKSPSGKCLLQNNRDFF